ncbi:MAG: hypothetical protein FWH08_01320 [Oscillospiraceae bacterium]|nr:hypothetical protein [Oscillospiraceae bacterium]
MNIFDVFIAYVSWDGGGKMRPVLIIEHQETVVLVFNITTQFESKSETVRSKYFKITDWQQAGLDKPSYVDTTTIRDLPPKVLEGKSETGKLTKFDAQRLIEFLAK